MKRDEKRTEDAMRGRMALAIAVVYSLADKYGACGWRGMVSDAIYATGKYTMSDVDEAIRLSGISKTR